MKLFFLSSLLIFFTFLSRPCYADSKDITNEAYVNSIYSAARKAWPALEQVWDTHIYRQLRLIVADDRNAWAIDSKTLTKIPYTEIQKRHLSVEYMYYQEIQWTDDRPTIYVSLGATLPPEEKALFQSEKEPVPTLFSVATHEAFHFFVQTNEWEKISSDNNSRATSYPIQPLPRVYRNNIIRSLYAFLQGEQNGLGHARYWFELWKKLYPDDANSIRQTDVNEGSAQYVEVAAEIIAQGKRFDTEEFQHALITKMKPKVYSVYTQSDSESYTIGALSGFILNMKNMKWQSDVIQGTPPLDILLTNISPITQQIDNKLEIEVEHNISKINDQVSGAIDDFRKLYSDPSVIKIFVTSALEGSVSLSGGFFRTKEIPYDLMVGLSSSATWTGGSYSTNEVVAASIGESPDYGGKSGFLILYAGKLPTSVKGRLVLKSEKLSLDIPYHDDFEKSRVIYLP